MSRLRVVDAGQVGAFRSQALWHGIAQAMTPTTAPTLSLCQPAEPYVGIGFHRSLAEVDSKACELLRLPIIRRQIGGGAVYIDSDQLFFQITLPAERAPRRVDRLYEKFLAPAVLAFRALGLNARIRGLNDISVDDRRLSGTGAGRIENGVTVVGNVIFKFPHPRMAEVLALPDESMRSEVLRLMKQHVSSLDAEGLGAVTMTEARSALVDSYARVLGLRPESDELNPEELAATEQWEQRFTSPAWLEGPGVTAPVSSGRQIKISADVWLYAASRNALKIQASFCGNTLDRIAISDPRLNGAGTEIENQLSHCPISNLAARLAPFGAPGNRILELLETGAVLR